MEGILSSLELEASYDPLQATSHLYQALKRHLGHLPASRAQRWAPRQWPCQQGGRMHPSKARATVAPLQVALPLFPSKGKENPESTQHPSSTGLGSGGSIPPCSKPQGKRGRGLVPIFC
ncbi:meiosis 1 arrest protein-like [Python bivittatus]|uniref:Meiosis 1 arrest protein-like n=1 Tax=Python bivittatus TaxID=176946 RepID=A0A9F2WIL6_PYTBI|nr:meiosis 1 arrest protein-like [Python bivittatus]